MCRLIVAVTSVFACLRDVRHPNMAQGEIVLTLRSICQKSTNGPKQIKL